MQRSSKGEVFVREFVMGIGFIGGLFARAGVDPEGKIVEALISAFQIDSSLFILFSVIFTIFTLLIAYFLGGPLGIFAIILAFGSGYIISSSSGIGAFLLIIAAVLGLIASSEKQQYIPYF